MPCGRIVSSIKKRKVIEMIPKINQTVYFLHWKNIRSGVVRNIFTKRINLKVLFLEHENMTLDESEIFESIDELLTNLKNNYEYFFGV